MKDASGKKTSEDNQLPAAGLESPGRVVIMHARYAKKKEACINDWSVLCIFTCDSRKINRRGRYIFGK